MKTPNIILIALLFPLTSGCISPPVTKQSAPAYTRENPYIPHGHRDHFGYQTQEKIQRDHRSATDTDFFRKPIRQIQ